MGIDFGEKRIGVALSDPTATLAIPFDTVRRRAGKRMPLTALEQIARDSDVKQLVVGLPLSLEGEETEWCSTVRRAGDELGRRLALDVAYVDERMTSVIAERRIRASGLPKSKREEKGRVDAAAAAVILQRWIDGKGAQGTTSGGDP